MTSALAGLITLLVGALVAGQLLVSATSKISGFKTYEQRLGGRALALSVIAADLATTFLVVAVPASSRSVYLVVAGFFAVGAIHRARVVHSPALTTCVCASTSFKTTWADVTSNIVVVALAATIALCDPARGYQLLVVSTVATATYLAFWWRLERQRRAARALRPDKTPQHWPHTRSSGRRRPSLGSAGETRSSHPV